MKQENDILETLGTAALAIIVVGVIMKAFERSKTTGLPILVEENGSLYEISPNGNKRFVRHLPARPKLDIPQKFTLR